MLSPPLETMGIEINDHKEKDNPMHPFLKFIPSTCKVMNDALISSQNKINLPDHLLESLPLTAKDKIDLEFIVKELDVDWVAVNFVQTCVQ
jgi:pyruvate kinase